ncbi:jg12916 [Pararge aegeria aegeria]|uniref:Jg12916 protein n=1 Tax=Pararge aegeria aegeria TaxID=348720 RepID=A0A8S4S6W5_9NEOP|nr:jg12916 [Pararge aegeria aegeria]
MDNLESESITNQPGKHLYGQLMYSTTHNHLKKWRYSDLSRWFISLLHPNSTRACFGSAPVIKIEYFGVSRYSTGTHAKIADLEDGRGVAGVTILSRLLGLPGQGWRERETDGKGWRRPLPKNGHSN